MADDSIEGKALSLPDRLRIIPDANGMMYDEYDDVMEAADLIEQLRVEAEAQYDRGYYDGCTRSVMQSEDCPKCDKFGDDCGEHSPSWEELAAYWKAEAERLRSIQEQSK
jgi:hypothetical protein